MGQAKAKGEQLRKRLLEQNDVWDFPPTDWEAELVNELLDMPVLMVPKAPANQLKEMRLPFNECHENTRWYAKSAPSGAVKSVAGWWVMENATFVLHSVLEQEGHYLCITPTQFSETKIPFIPDEKIMWEPAGDRYEAYRNGQKIGPGVRRFPREAMIQNAAFRARLKSGMNPHRAMNFTPEEWGEAKKKYGS